MLPSPGQGALACECRVEDLGTAHALAAVLDDAGVRTAVALAAVVEDLDDGGQVVLRLSLRGVATTTDGDLLRSSATGKLTYAEQLGRHVAAELLDLGASAPSLGLLAGSTGRPG